MSSNVQEIGQIYAKGVLHAFVFTSISCEKIHCKEQLYHLHITKLQAMDRHSFTFERSVCRGWVRIPAFQWELGWINLILPATKKILQLTAYSQLLWTHSTVYWLIAISVMPVQRWALRLNSRLFEWRERGLLICHTCWFPKCKLYHTAIWKPPTWHQLTWKFRSCSYEPIWAPVCTSMHHGTYGGPFHHESFPPSISLPQGLTLLIPLPSSPCQFEATSPYPFMRRNAKVNVHIKYIN